VARCSASRRKGYLLSNGSEKGQGRQAGQGKRGLNLAEKRYAGWGRRLGAEGKEGEESRYAQGLTCAGEELGGDREGVSDAEVPVAGKCNRASEASGMIREKKRG